MKDLCLPSLEWRPCHQLLHLEPWQDRLLGLQNETFQKQEDNAEYVRPSGKSQKNIDSCIANGAASVRACARWNAVQLL